MKQALLAVSFGTSVPRARQDIEAVERVLAAGAPERAFCRAYTSPTIRRILAERGEPVPGLPEALEALAAAGVEDAAVQPTHLLYGFEYDKLKADAAAFAGRFARLALGRPLAADSESLRALAAWIEGVQAWHLQSFIDADSVLGGEGRFHAWDPDDLRALLPELQAVVPGAQLRGVD